MHIAQIVNRVRAALSTDLLRADYARRKPPTAPASWGLCYVAAEAVYHLAGGASSGLRPASVRIDAQTVHWYLLDRDGNVIDPTSDQFAETPHYAGGCGRGFLTREPSARARVLMQRLEA